MTNNITKREPDIMRLLMEIYTTTQEVHLPKALKRNLISPLDCQITGNTGKETHANDTGGMQSENPGMWETLQKN